MTAKVAVVGATILLALIVLAVTVLVYRAREQRHERLRKGLATRGDLSRSQEQQLIALTVGAAEIFGTLGVTMQLDDPEIIRADTRRQVNAWMADYRRYK